MDSFMRLSLSLVQLSVHDVSLLWTRDWPRLQWWMKVRVENEECIQVEVNWLQCPQESGDIDEEKFCAISSLIVSLMCSVI